MYFDSYVCINVTSFRWAVLTDMEEFQAKDEGNPEIVRAVLFVYWVSTGCFGVS